MKLKALLRNGCVGTTLVFAWTISLGQEGLWQCGHEYTITPSDAKYKTTACYLVDDTERPRSLPQNPSQALLDVSHKTTAGCRVVFNVPSAQSTIRPKKLEWSGQCVSGYAEGAGTMTVLWASGVTTKTVATFRKGREEGYGTEEARFPTGESRLYRGNFWHGTGQGRGEEMRVNAKGETMTVYKGEFRDGKPWGTGRFEFGSILVYDGEVQDGTYHGRGTFEMRGRFKVTGYFLKGKSPVSGRIDYPDGSYYEGQIDTYWMHGQGRMTYPTGTVYAGEFKKNMADGQGVLISNGIAANVRADQGKFSRVYSEAEVAEVARIEGQRRINEQREQEALLRAQRAQQLAELGLQLQEQQRRDRESATYLCMAAMMGRPTTFGTAGESMANIAACNADSNANLRPPAQTQSNAPRLPITCTTNTFTGRAITTCN